MPYTDTLFVADSISCKYIDFEHYPARTDIISPVSVIWDRSTIVPVVKNTRIAESNLERNVLSGIVFIFFIILIFFIRRILPGFPHLISTIWSYNNHKKIEEKTGLSYIRNVTAWLSLLFIPIALTVTSGTKLKSIYGLFIPNFVPIILFGIVGIWIIRHLIFRFATYITRDKTTFKLIERISYNYFIVGALISLFTLIFRLIAGNISSNGMIDSFIIIFLSLYILYVFRTFQVIIGSHFSIVFYILYLCAVEILPLSILTNIILVL